MNRKIGLILATSFIVFIGIYIMATIEIRPRNVDIAGLLAVQQELLMSVFGEIEENDPDHI